MTRIKRLLISFIATLPIPGVAVAAQFSKVTPLIEKEHIRASFFEVLVDDLLPESYYIILHNMNITTVEELIQPEHRDVLQILYNQWSHDKNANVLLTGGVTSELPTER